MIKMPPPFATDEEVVAYVEESVAKAEQARVLCNVIIPMDGRTPAVQQERNYKSYLMLHGAALATCVMAHRFGKLSDEQYAQFTGRVRATMASTGVGGVSA